jgi:hypothetical protein
MSRLVRLHPRRLLGLQQRPRGMRQQPRMPLRPALRRLVLPPRRPVLPHPLPGRVRGHPRLRHLGLLRPGVQRLLAGLGRRHLPQHPQLQLADLQLHPARRQPGVQRLVQRQPGPMLPKLQLTRRLRGRGRPPPQNAPLPLPELLLRRLLQLPRLHQGRGGVHQHRPAQPQRRHNKVRPGRPRLLLPGECCCWEGKCTAQQSTPGCLLVGVSNVQCATIARCLPQPGASLP